MVGCIKLTTDRCYMCHIAKPHTHTCCGSEDALNAPLVVLHCGYQAQELFSAHANPAEHHISHKCQANHR